MSKYDLSICQPALRPHYWEKFYNSLKAACNRYSWELILVAPYDPPAEVAKQKNVKFIKEYCNSCKAAMIGSLQCEGELMAILADDGVAFPNSLDQAIDVHREVNQPKDVIVLRYREGDKNKELPLKYWYARHHSALHNLNIHRDWAHLMQWMMTVEYFKEIGGYDCRFEHMAYAGHDLAYRIQRDGGKCHLSTIEVMQCDWFRGNKGDHGPVAESHVANDKPLFHQIQMDKNVNSRTRIDFDDYKSCPDVWARRWPNGTPQ